MFPSKALVSFLLVALSAVNATPLRRDSQSTLTASYKSGSSGGSPVGASQARAQAMKNTGVNTKRETPSPALHMTGVDFVYTIDFYLGSPSTLYTVIFDTGSSNSWIGASIPYYPTGSSQDTHQTVSVNYGFASFSGEEYIDAVTLEDESTITQSIGVAKDVQGFNGVPADGIAGFGPSDLTIGTTSDHNVVPTLMDNYKAQGAIANEIFGVNWVPEASTDPDLITVGHYDTSKIATQQKEVNFVPITTTSPSNLYWGVDLSISYDNAEILTLNSGVFDSATALILIASDAFSKYQAATGATLDPQTNMLTITTDGYNKLKTLAFNIGGNTYELSPNAQIWSRAINDDIGGNPDQMYLVIGDIGNDSGSGLDIIMGIPMFQRFLMVFDADHHQIGLAQTTHTFDNTN